MWTKPLPKKVKSKPPVDVRCSKTLLLIYAYIYVSKKKWEAAKGMGKDKREPKICIMENVSGRILQGIKFLVLESIKVCCWNNMNDVFVVVQCYPWFKFYFVLFQSHNHT